MSLRKAERRKALGVRLLLGASLAIALALVVAGAAIALLFERHIQNKLAGDLEVHLAQLEGSIQRAADGGLRLSRQPSDPRFATPLSGLYWQAEAEGQLLRSRSLWDERLVTLPGPLTAGVTRTSSLAGPAGQRLMLSERRIGIGADPPTAVRVAVAADLARIEALRDDFVEEMAVALSLFWLVMMLGAFVQVRLGLRPLRDLTAEVARLRAGHARRIEAGGPSEVAPLVEEINILLAARDAATEQARRRAGDLAHGLKTPLAALMGDAERLRLKGECAIADDLALTAEDMRRHVERHLVHARLTHAGGRSATAVPTVVRGLVATLERTPDGERITFVTEGPDLEVAVPRDDLMDCLGNLLENATRHAGSTVRVSWRAGPDWMIVIEDDGPGIPADRREQLMQRGARLDERGGGAGLGLAIASDIATAHGLALELGDASFGGLRVVLSPVREVGSNVRDT